MLHGDAARPRPLRQVAGLEPVAEDEPCGTGHARNECDDDRGRARERDQRAPAEPAEKTDRVYGASHKKTGAPVTVIVAATIDQPSAPSPIPARDGTRRRDEY